jgi:hypothetical protein
VRAACVAGLALALAGIAHAGPQSDADAAYKRERAVCMSGTSNQDRATCLKEAGAARQEARRNGLGGPSDSELAGNRNARCDAQPAADRSACLQRMGAGAATSGSEQQGGILRETTQPVARP